MTMTIEERRVESAAAREYRRLREFFKRCCNRLPATSRTTRFLTAAFVGSLVEMSESGVTNLVELGLLDGERGPDGGMVFSIADILGFVGAPTVRLVQPDQPAVTGPPTEAVWQDALRRLRALPAELRAAPRFSLAAAAEALRMSQDQVQELAEAGTLAGTRSRSGWRFSTDDLMGFLDPAPEGSARP